MDNYALCRIADRIPPIPCIPGCMACCGHVPWSRAEFERLPKNLKTHYVDNFHSMRCPFARGGRCIAWEFRPVTCRMFGVTDGLLCPQGVIADQVLSMDDARKIIEEYVTTFF